MSTVINFNLYYKIQSFLDYCLSMWEKAASYFQSILKSIPPKEIVSELLIGYYIIHIENISECILKCLKSCEKLLEQLNWQMHVGTRAVISLLFCILLVYYCALYPRNFILYYIHTHQVTQYLIQRCSGCKLFSGRLVKFAEIQCKFCHCALQVACPVVYCQLNLTYGMD